MDGEVVIKEEPMSDTELETSRDGDDYMSYAAIEHLKVEYGQEEINNMHVDHVEETTTFKIPTEKSNVIKTENDLCFLKQSLNEADHAYARFDNDTKFPLNPLFHANNGEPKGASYDCRKNCGKKFGTLTERALHESHEHKSMPRNIKCNFCNKNFDSFFALTRHMPEHRNVQRYVCTHCSKCCPSYQDLQNHWKSSAGCFKKEFDAPKKISQTVLEEPRRITILKTLPSNKKETKTPFDQNIFNEIPAKLDSVSYAEKSLLLLPRLLQPKSQPLSFAEEIKAFAAKYQLKSNLVAKKRTSATVINPTETKRRRSTKKSENEKNESKPQYAVPKAIGPLNGSISNPLLNVKIKEEPIDHFDEQLFDEQNPNEIEIKNEPLDDYVEVKNEPLDDPVENSITTDNLTENIESDATRIEETKNSSIPQSPIAANIPQIPLKCLKFFKITPVFTNELRKRTLPLTTAKFENKFPISDAKELKNVKILKLAPNAKIVKLPSIKLDSLKSVKENNLTPKQTTTDTNQQSPEEIPFVPIKLPFSSAQSKDNTPVSVDPSTVEKMESTIKKEVESNESPVENTIEDALSNGKQRKRINCVPKKVLRFIEQQPQKIKIIEDLQRQIQLAESVSTTTSLILPDKTEVRPVTPEQKIIKTDTRNEANQAANEDLPLPASMYILITNCVHPELSKARRENPKYRFSWMCPRCPKRYDQKHAFLGHLVSAHGMCHEEWENLYVEVKPHIIESKTENKLKKRKKPKDNEIVKGDSVQETEKTPNTLSMPKTQLKCTNCKRVCSSRTMLNDHLAGDCGRVPIYKCTKCPKAFYSASTLSCHLTIHTGELPYKCNYCDKRFRTRGQVTVHHRTHTGERPFICQICSQGFTHRETLISHLSRHIGMKRYRCYACNKHFSCVSGLKTHHELRPNTCGLVKLNTRAVGPRVRVVRGQVIFEPQPEINPYLRTEDPQEILSEIQNIQKTNS